MLTRKEAMEFLKKTLDIGDSIPEQPGPEKLTFINTFVKKYHLTIPFQNITHLADSDRNDVPNLEVIKEDILQKRGGLCYTNNVFVLHLLAALGYEVEALSGTCNPVHPDNHIAVKLRHVLRENDNYLVDVACGSPTYEAVCLDFTHESQIFTWGYLVCKFVKKVDRIERFHAKVNGEYLLPTALNSQKEIDWALYYHLDDIPRSIEYFYPSMHEVYANRFRKKITGIRFSGDSMSVLKTVKGDEGTLSVTSIILTPTEITRCVVERKDIVKYLHDLLPEFDSAVISQAVENWQNDIG